jgi:antitoxin component YwqK of YwqJK toxin-antitoxin module
MRFVIFILAISTLFFSCDQPVVKTDTPTQQPFRIEGTTQQVLQAFSDGKTKVAVYVDSVSGQKVAEVEFHGNGQPKIDKRFVRDTLQGESWCYYENGSPWSLNTFEDGLNHGPYKTWHENGQLYIEGQYDHGKKTGEWFTYYANGGLNTRGTYQNDEKVGVWNSYNLEGTMKREQDFGAKEKR